jgi:hypothetical protein
MKKHVMDEDIQTLILESRSELVQLENKVIKSYAQMTLEQFGVVDRRAHELTAIINRYEGVLRRRKQKRKARPRTPVVESKATAADVEELAKIF